MFKDTTKRGQNSENVNYRITFITLNFILYFYSMRFYQVAHYLLERGIVLDRRNVKLAANIGLAIQASLRSAGFSYTLVMDMSYFNLEKRAAIYLNQSATRSDRLKITKAMNDLVHDDRGLYISQTSKHLPNIFRFCVNFANKLCNQQTMRLSKYIHWLSVKTNREIKIMPHSKSQV